MRFGEWAGETAVVMASGPSMCSEDAEYVRGKARTIVVNTTFRLAPWADFLYSNDHDWMEMHLHEIGLKFKGDVICGHSAYMRDPVIDHIPFDKWAIGLRAASGCIAWGMNSGGAAISLAHRLGASRIVLLGYDQQWTNNMPRWHGRHPGQLQNQKPGFHRWAEWFEQAAIDAKDEGISIVNCSRETSLACFPRMALQEALPC